MKPLRAAAMAAALLGAAAVLYRFDPMRTAWYPRCPFFLVTGLYCPGCGALRAGHALLHGELAAALGFNALLVLALPLFGAAAAARLRAAWSGRRLPLLPATGIWGIVVVLITFSVLRNLRVMPFQTLAP